LWRRREYLEANPVIDSRAERSTSRGLTTETSATNGSERARKRDYRLSVLASRRPTVGRYAWAPGSGRARGHGERVEAEALSRSAVTEFEGYVKLSKNSGAP